MALTPRAAEKTAMVELLEGEWDSSDALATALLKKAFEVFQERDLWGLAVDYAGLRVVYGPYATEGDVGRAHKALAVGVGYVGRLHAAASTATREDTQPTLGLCGGCGHVKGTHTHPRSMGYCLAGASHKDARPCPCQQYTN